MEEATSPHGNRLRLHRCSETGRSYSLTMCCESRHPYFQPSAIRALVARTIEESVEHGVDILHGYVVMPDHVHVLLKLGRTKTLEQTVGDLKKTIARRVNDLLERRGKVWQRGYFEHSIRGDKDYQRYLEYIVSNPVRSGLVEPGEDYPWCRFRPLEGR